MIYDEILKGDLIDLTNIMALYVSKCSNNLLISKL